MRLSSPRLLPAALALLVTGAAALEQGEEPTKKRVKVRKAELGSVIAVKGNLTAQGTPQLICRGWSCDPDGPFQEWIIVQQIAAKRFSFGRDQSGCVSLPQF